DAQAVDDRLSDLAKAGCSMRYPVIRLPLCADNHHWICRQRIDLSPSGNAAERDRTDMRKTLAVKKAKLNFCAVVLCDTAQSFAFQPSWKPLRICHVL